MSGTTEPVLVEGLDAVLLIRLYPEADGITDAGSKALAQGAQTAADSAVLEGSQYEPILGTDAPDAPPSGPPMNMDVPYVSQDADRLLCTMGNWEGTPTSYAYAWKVDGASVGSNAATYTTTADDVGKTATCVVTATNAAGSTVAPPSNSVVVAAAARSGPGPKREA